MSTIWAAKFEGKVEIITRSTSIIHHQPYLVIPRHLVVVANLPEINIGTIYCHQWFRDTILLTSIPPYLEQSWEVWVGLGRGFSPVSLNCYRGKLTIHSIISNGKHLVYGKKPKSFSPSPTKFKCVATHFPV